jgi:hypothetical protein
MVTMMKTFLETGDQKWIKYLDMLEKSWVLPLNIESWDMKERFVFPFCGQKLKSGSMDKSLRMQIQAYHKMNLSSN